MPSQPTNREMVATLLKKMGALPTSVEAHYDKKGALLDLSLTQRLIPYPHPPTFSHGLPFEA